MSRFQAEAPTLASLAEWFVILWPFFFAAVLGWWITGNNERREQSQLYSRRVRKAMARRRHLTLTQIR